MWISVALRGRRPGDGPVCRCGLHSTVHKTRFIKKKYILGFLCRVLPLLQSDSISFKGKAKLSATLTLSVLRWSLIQLTDITNEELSEFLLPSGELLFACLSEGAKGGACCTACANQIKRRPQNCYAVRSCRNVFWDPFRLWSVRRVCLGARRKRCDQTIDVTLCVVTVVPGRQRTWLTVFMVFLIPSIQTPS